jgi:hypothetical protein
MGYYTILQGLVSLHREWMIRAYVVTFAFVTFRLLQDYGPVSHLRPENDRDITIAWACWVVPLPSRKWPSISSGCGLNWRASNHPKKMRLDVDQASLIQTVDQ